MVGPHTRYPTSFRDKVHKELLMTDKVVNLKFDLLNLDSLEYIKKYGCRVLHFSSEVFTDDCLCIEGRDGEI